MEQKRVLVDTNVIIEALHIGCWKVLCNKHSVETVEKCIEEALTGNRRRPINPEIFKIGIIQHPDATKKELATLELTHPHCSGLDDGEKHLLARLHADKALIATGICISTADKAALRAAHSLGWLSRLISLEELAEQTGIKSKNFRDQYCKTWLTRFKTQLRLEKPL